MNQDEFEAVVDAALERLPDWVHEVLENIDVLVVDEADGHLDPDGDGLLGLSPDDSRDEIATTLIHEIAHDFGIDDEQLDERGWG